MDDLKVADLKERRKYVRLSEKSWAEIEAAWMDGCVTLEELSERYGVSRRTLQSHFSRGGFEKGARATLLAATVRERVMQEDSKNADDLAERARQTRERAFRSADLVEDLLIGQLELIRRDPTQVARVSAATKALSLAASALERVHAIKARALGIDRDETMGSDLPVLEFVDLSEDDIARMRKEQEEVDDDAPVLSPSDAPSVDHSPEDDEVVEEERPSFPVDKDGIRLVGHRRI